MKGEKYGSEIEIYGSGRNFFEPELVAHLVVNYDSGQEALTSIFANLKFKGKRICRMEPIGLPGNGHYGISPIDISLANRQTVLKPEEINLG